MSTPDIPSSAGRDMTYAEAIRDAFAVALEIDPELHLLGLGVPDPKGFFGTTSNLGHDYGFDRVLDMPCAEAGMTGVALGSALGGVPTVINHQRLDFALLGIDALCTQAAKWSYMFGGQTRLPLVIRAIIGRGWGQGPQHSQSLHSWFAHVPGLKVVMPSIPHDAKGMLIAAIEDGNPVVFLEHRWLHHLKGFVPNGHYTVPIGSARLAREGKDITIAAISYMVIEALDAAEQLAKEGVSVEVIDVRSLRPLDRDMVSNSVAKTGHLVVADSAWAAAGMAAEIITVAIETSFSSLRSAPRRVCFPDCPTPTSPPLAAAFYPRSGHIVAAVRNALQMPPNASDFNIPTNVELDKPNPAFTGPF
jgi:pyruvate dehydrogenase E1 component beta subunit